MHPVFIRKLEGFGPLSEADKQALNGMTGTLRLFRGGEDLYKEGVRPDAVFLITEGWACEYKMLPDGQRQIMSYLLPGDTCDVFNFVLDVLDHSIGAMGPCKALAIPQADLQAVIDAHPAIARALYWTTLVDAGTLREWLLNVGQRDGMARGASVLRIVAAFEGRGVGDRQ